MSTRISSQTGSINDSMFRNSAGYDENIGSVNPLRKQLGSSTKPTGNGDTKSDLNSSKEISISLENQSYKVDPMNVSGDIEEDLEEDLVSENSFKQRKSFKYTAGSLHKAALTLNQNEGPLSGRTTNVSDDYSVSAKENLDGSSNEIDGSSISKYKIKVSLNSPMVGPVAATEARRPLTPIPSDTLQTSPRPLSLRKSCSKSQPSLDVPVVVEAAVEVETRDADDSPRAEVPPVVDEPVVSSGGKRSSAALATRMSGLDPFKLALAGQARPVSKPRVSREINSTSMNELEVQPGGSGSVAVPPARLMHHITDNGVHLTIKTRHAAASSSSVQQQQQQQSVCDVLMHRVTRKTRHAPKRRAFTDAVTAADDGEALHQVAIMNQGDGSKARLSGKRNRNIPLPREDPAAVSRGSATAVPSVPFIAFVGDNVNASSSSEASAAVSSVTPSTAMALTPAAARSNAAAVASPFDMEVSPAPTTVSDVSLLFPKLQRMRSHTQQIDIPLYEWGHLPLTASEAAAGEESPPPLLPKKSRSPLLAVPALMRTTSGVVDLADIYGADDDDEDVAQWDENIFAPAQQAARARELLQQSSFDDDNAAAGGGEMEIVLDDVYGADVNEESEEYEDNIMNITKHRTVAAMKQSSRRARQQQQRARQVGDEREDTPLEFNDVYGSPGRYFDDTEEGYTEDTENDEDDEIGDNEIAAATGGGAGAYTTNPFYAFRRKPTRDRVSPLAMLEIDTIVPFHGKRCKIARDGELEMLQTTFSPLNTATSRDGANLVEEAEEGATHNASSPHVVVMPPSPDVQSTSTFSVFNMFYWCL